MSFMVLYGFLEISNSTIRVAKIAVRSPFFFLVSQFIRNFKVLIMVLYGFLNISKTMIGFAKSEVRASFSFLVSHFF